MPYAYFPLGLEHPLPRPSEQETGRVSQYMASMKAKAKENVMHRQKQVYRKHVWKQEKKWRGDIGNESESKKVDRQVNRITEKCK